MMAYNHENYISKAIEGVLMQKTNFGFEIVIGEDCSTDKTREIILSYKKTYPGKFKLILHEKNVGAMANQNAVFSACTGKYIAMCEGDDYWTDPYKLQKQVDFLEASTDYGMVCTDYNKLYMSNGLISKNSFKLQKYKDEVKFKDYIIDRSTIGTATVMFATHLYDSYLRDIPKEVLESFNVGDTPLWLYIMLNSRVGVLSDVTAMYLINLQSASKFVNPHDHYSFVTKGFKVPEYFLSIYNGHLKDELRTKLEKRKQLSTLHYAFKVKDKKLFLDSFRQIKKQDRTIKIMLWRVGLITNFAHNIVNFILKIYKSI